MKIEPANEDPSKVYSLMIRAITPRPIAWVSTVSAGGIPNLAPFSYFNGVCSDPAALMFSPVNHADGARKDTVRNIESNGQFVVNMVPHSLATEMLKTAGRFDHEVSEFDTAEIETEPAEKIAPPSVKISPIKFECELIQIVEIGSGPLAANLVIGKILLIDVADDILGDDGKIDPEKADLIARMGGRAYATTRDRFDITPESE